MSQLAGYLQDMAQGRVPAPNQHVPTEREMENYLRAAEEAHKAWEEEHGEHADWVPFYAAHIIQSMVTARAASNRYRIDG